MHCLTGTRETPDSLAKFLGCLVRVILAIPSHLLNFVHLLGGNERVKFHSLSVERGGITLGAISLGAISHRASQGSSLGTSLGAPNNTRQTQGKPRQAKLGICAAGDLKIVQLPLYEKKQNRSEIYVNNNKQA